MVVEQIVELDEELMMRYLEGETVAPDELRRAAHDAIAQGKLVPVLCVCTRKDLGLRELLDLIAVCGLSPDDIHRFGTRAARPTAPRKKSCPSRKVPWSPRCSRPSTTSSWASSSYLRISRAAGLRHHDRQSAQRQDDQDRPHLRPPGQTAGGSSRGDRRRHRGHRQVRRSPCLRHRQQRRRQHRRLAASSGQADQVPGAHGPAGGRAQGPRRRGQDLRRDWPRSPTKTRPFRSAATLRLTSSSSRA